MKLVDHSIVYETVLSLQYIKVKTKLHSRSVQETTVGHLLSYYFADLVMRLVPLRPPLLPLPRRLLLDPVSGKASLMPITLSGGDCTGCDETWRAFGRPRP